MKTIKFTIVAALMVLFSLSEKDLTSQVWQQTATTPEGGGVTQLLVADNGTLFVSVASTDNYPSGDWGGVRRSTDGGETWENLMDAYTGRYITQGNDGYIYAVVWAYPIDEGLFRSTDYGDEWEYLTSVPVGNNIFSVTVNTNTSPTTIFAGTGQGILRSTDDGNTWGYYSTGIDPGSWILCMDIDADGIVAAGTTSGYYISTDNGDSWTKGGGAIDSDTITSLKFYIDPTSAKSKNGDDHLYLSARTDGDAAFARAIYSDEYLLATLLFIFDNDVEVSGIYNGWLGTLNKKLLGVTHFPKGSFGGGYYQSTDDGENFIPIVEGLPENAKASSLAAEDDSKQSLRLYAGLFEGMDGGAKVYYLDQELTGQAESQQPPADIGLRLHPNPFKKAIEISFQLPQYSFVKLEIHDPYGKMVYSGGLKEYPPGNNAFRWEAEGMANGIYLYSLIVDDRSYTGKVIKQ